MVKGNDQGATGVEEDSTQSDAFAKVSQAFSPVKRYNIRECRLSTGRCQPSRACDGWPMVKSCRFLSRLEPFVCGRETAHWRGDGNHSRCFRREWILGHDRVHGAEPGGGSRA